MPSRTTWRNSRASYSRTRVPQNLGSPAPEDCARPIEFDDPSFHCDGDATGAGKRRFIVDWEAFERVHFCAFSDLSGHPLSECRFNPVPWVPYRIPEMMS